MRHIVTGYRLQEIRDLDRQFQSFYFLIIPHRNYEECNIINLTVRTDEKVSSIPSINDNSMVTETEG
jgi:hypothetical protein